MVDIVTVDRKAIPFDSINGNPYLCQGRLTLGSGSPVTTADVTAATSVYFTPYNGDYISLYDGTNWITRQFTEKSLSISGYTSGSCYDIFAYDNAGTVTLESTSWTNTTTRATPLVYQNGIYVKSGVTTRRYLGTIYTSATGQCEDSEVKRYCWNYYNRISRRLFKYLSDSHTYTTASWRAWNNNTANKVEFIYGISQDSIQEGFYSATTGVAGASTGLDLDAASAPDVFYTSIGTGANGASYIFGVLNPPGIGYHYLQMIQKGATTATFVEYSILGNIFG